MSSTDQVVQQCKSLRLCHLAGALDGLVASAEANELSYLQFAEALVSQEISARSRKRIELNRRKAGFPVRKSLEEFDYRHQSSITKRQVNQLLDFSFIDNRSNLVFIGPPGVGKTHLPSVSRRRPSTPDTRYCSAPPWGWLKLWRLPNSKGNSRRRSIAWPNST